MQLLPGVTPSSPPLIKRLERHEKGARPRHLLHVDQLLAAAELAGGNVVLHVVTTIGIMVQGLDTHVTSAIMPIFMICASICPKPACRTR